MLVIAADDYGYASAYDAGILAAARAGALDAVGAMVLRAPDPEPLLGLELEVGLHLERLSEIAVAEQLARFEGWFGRPPAYLDGHHHCHAEPEATAREVGAAAAQLQIPVRAVSPGHRRLLRGLGVGTADRLVGRQAERDPGLPPEIADLLEASAPAEEVTEWMVHPGYPDSGAGSGYDRGRGEDLRLLLELGDRSAWARRGVARAGPLMAIAGRAWAG